jgi:hypothetical protein
MVAQRPHPLAAHGLALPVVVFVSRPLNEQVIGGALAADADAGLGV